MRGRPNDGLVSGPKQCSESKRTDLPLRPLLLGFFAGFVATVVFHQGLWWLFTETSIIQAANPAWPTEAVPPLGVPSVISKAFWGGIWGLMLAPSLVRLSGARYWVAWILIGAVLLTGVALFVILPLKGQPAPALWPRFAIGMALNGAWGFGTALLLRALAYGRPD